MPQSIDSQNQKNVEKQKIGKFGLSFLNISGLTLSGIVVLILIVIAGGFLAYFKLVPGTQQPDQQASAAIRAPRYIEKITCGPKNYIVEQGIPRKNRISRTGMAAFRLTNANFESGGVRCRYITNTRIINDLVRTRESNRVYIVDNRHARRVLTQGVADAWQLGNIGSIQAPVLHGASLKRLATTSLYLTHIAANIYPSSPFGTVYIIDKGTRISTGGFYSSNTGRFANTCDLARQGSTIGNRSVSQWGRYTQDFLLRRTKAPSSTVARPCSFLKSGSNYYVLDTGRIRLLTPVDVSRWRNISFYSVSDLNLTDNMYNFSASTIASWPQAEQVGKFFRYTNPISNVTVYYRLTNGVGFHRTFNRTTAQDWGAANAPQILVSLHDLIEDADPFQYN